MDNDLYSTILNGHDLLMHPFDPIHSPLTGTCLIEAGAGTGKTYTITTLVLRLVLQEALSPEQILVVTFTTAATAELRDRVRRRLRDAKSVLLGGASGDAVLDELLENCGPKDVALERLEDALANFDRMPVFTIHGFCQRILAEMAFETGSGFDAQLVTDPAAIIQGLADDFWRQTWYQAPSELIALALKTIKNPEELAARYHRYAIPDLTILPEASDPSPVASDAFRGKCAEMRHLWRTSRTDILAFLDSPSLKANIYGSLDRPASRDGFHSKREEKIQFWADLLDRWALPEASGYPLPDILTYFTQTKLDASLKKGMTGPRHAFFEGCDRLMQETDRMETGMHRWLIALQVRFFHFMKAELKRYKHEKQIIFFDDLLLMVRDALHRDKQGQLKRLLRTRYRAALIDEFQDTDAVQYDIFSTLFGTDGHLMFMIGDPKQAIYSFRGADIFTYLHAARSVGRRYTLTQNWRSTPGMVQAVNMLFEQNPRPFLWPEIAFHPATAAREKPFSPQPDTTFTPLTIWFLDNPVLKTGRAAFNKKIVTERICLALANEVRHLVRASVPGEGEITYKDMAILVRTNRQAGEVKGVLAAADIPAVVYNAGSVFHRPEALDLQRLLAAVADPGSEKKVRTALTSRFFGWLGADFDFAEDAPVWWEETLSRFYRYRERWIEGGFIRMFRRLMLNEKIAARLLDGPSGERYLTNILHLAELMHQVSVERGMGANELIQWLEMQRLQPRDAADAHQTRLESDDDAVTILTIHKSKGLEYPIVFCPFVWEGLGRPAPPALFQREGHDGQRILDWGSADIDHHLARMAEERMAEELRLLYVALTRAKIRCYLVWGRLPSAEYSALAYLMHFTPDNHQEITFWDKLQDTARTFLRQDNGQHRQDIENLAQRSSGAIGVIDLPEETTYSFGETDLQVQVSPPRHFSRAHMPTWRIASFSSLIHQRHDEVELSDDPLDGQDLLSDALQAEQTDDTTPFIGDIGRFEASARAGLFFHEILELIDYSDTTPERWQGVIEDRIRDYGFDLNWKNAICEVVSRVVRTPLAPKPGKTFTLSQVPNHDRLIELEFHLPLQSVDAIALSRAFSIDPMLPFQERLPRLVEQLDFSLSGGYLKGYIDLVFRIDGQYFIADWKSNHLGDTFGHYRPGALLDVMEAEFYFLQYHIYTLALDQYLRSCNPDYTYSRHFGGVFYFFIRGMGPTVGPSTGVFFDRPASELLRNLRQTLVKKPLL